MAKQHPALVALVLRPAYIEPVAHFVLIVRVLQVEYTPVALIASATFVVQAVRVAHPDKPSLVALFS